MHQENESGVAPPSHNKPHQKELLTAARGGGLGLMGMVCSRVLMLLLQAAVARLFGITFFGYYITGLMLCRILQVIAGIGLPIGSMRYLVQSRERGDQQAMFLIYRISVLAPLFCGSLSGGVLYITAPYLCNNVFSEPNLIPVLRIFALSVPWFALLRILAEMSKSFGTVRYTVLIEDILFPVLHIGLLISAYLISDNGLIVVLTFLLSTACCAILMGFVVYQQIKHCIIPEKQLCDVSTASTVLELLMYSIPLMPSGIFFMVSNNIDIFMLNILNNGGAVGIYAAATRWTLLVDAVGMPIYSIFRPLIAKAVTTNDLQALRSLFMASCRWVLYLILPFTACLILASQPAMEFFTKEGVTGTASFLLWTLLAARITNPFGNGAGLVLTMGGHQYRELLSLVSGAGLNVVLNTILIPQYGVIGAAVATGAGFYLTTIIRIFFVWKKWKMTPWSRNLLPAVSALGLVIIVRFFLSLEISQYWQIATGGIGALSVSCTILLFGREQDDKNVILLLSPAIRRKISRFLNILPGSAL